MAHCVISRVHDVDDSTWRLLEAALGGPVTACMVHAHRHPCPHDGEPAVRAPVHTDDHVGRVPAVAEWATRTARQRPLVIHQGSLACAAPAHETDGVLCWCRPEVIPATGDQP
jgi:hypothetical protein